MFAPEGCTKSYKLGVKLVLFEAVVDGRSVKTNNNIAGNIDDRDTPLTTFGNRFGGKKRIGFDVTLFVFDAQLIKVSFSGVTKGTPGCTVDNNL